MDNFKSLAKKLNPAVPKRVLLIVAGLFWLMVSVRILMLSSKYFLMGSDSFWLFAALSLPSYLIFFYFVFFRLIKKHTFRIISKTNYACIFGFFDWKSYGIMAFMVVLGILTVYRFNIPHFPLSVFFFALGFSMLSAAIYFFYYAIRFDYTSKKFYKKVHQ
ncbi:MAG: hypothetical protein GX437_08340 [Sphingobacteriales bacterium]|nr:hypothetical protein [Sphingobacteriales bacterium]